MSGKYMFFIMEFNLIIFETTNAKTENDIQVK